MQRYVFLYLLPPPQLWPSVLQGGPELEVVFALLCFTVPNGPFFRLDFLFHNIRWQKPPQLKKTHGKTAIWKKPFWHIPYLYLTVPQLSCDGKFLLQLILPAVTVITYPFSVIPFLLPPPQIIVYLVSLRMLFHSALHTSFLHSYCLILWDRAMSSIQVKMCPNNVFYFIPNYCLNTSIFCLVAAEHWVAIQRTAHNDSIWCILTFLTWEKLCECYWPPSDRNERLFELQLSHLCPVTSLNIMIRVPLLSLEFWQNLWLVMNE